MLTISRSDNCKTEAMTCFLLVRVEVIILLQLVYNLDVFSGMV